MPAGEVFGAFLRLGLTSFGGPVAHIGYFRREFVERRKWLGDAAFADLLGLCQFLPGPASSQLGFAIGLQRAGWAGALAAWCGFTLPSAVLMLAFAALAPTIGGTASGVMHGLKLAAVAIVAQAVIAMARTLAPDIQRAGIALAALALVIVAGSATGQLPAIIVGATFGTLLCRGPAVATCGSTLNVSRRVALAALAAFLGLLLGMPLLAAATDWLPARVFDAFYHAGALVFGGGHVVLPLLQARLVPPGWVASDIFLSGYALAQALPGPLFTFATYLGAVLVPQPGGGSWGIAGAALATVAIFLPGLLLLVVALPFQDRLRAQPSAQAALRGANAAVVGVLAAALYDPVWVGGVAVAADAAIAALGLLALMAFRAPPLVIVIGCALAGAALG